MRTPTAPPTMVRLWWMLTLLTLFGAEALLSREANARTPRFVRVKVDVANVRALPSPTAAQVRSAYENEPLQVVSQQGRWLEVQDVAGHTAWIYASLTDGRPAVVVVRDLVNVRKRPGVGHPIAFTAERGVNLLVLERAGRWLRVRHKVGEGWLHDSLVWGAP